MPVRPYRKDKIDEPDELEESVKFLLEHEQLEPGSGCLSYRNQFEIIVIKYQS